MDFEVFDRRQRRTGGAYAGPAQFTITSNGDVRVTVRVLDLLGDESGGPRPWRKNMDVELMLDRAEHCFGIRAAEHSPSSVTLSVTGSSGRLRRTDVFPLLVELGGVNWIGRRTYQAEKEGEVVFVRLPQRRAGGRQRGGAQARRSNR